MNLPSPLSLALTFFVKLILIKVFINEIGIEGARDIFVMSSIAQLAFLLQFGKLAKSKNMVLLGEIGVETLNCVFFAVNIIFLSTVLVLTLSTILLIATGYFDIQFELVIFGFTYGYFILQTQLYLLRYEAAGNKQRSYLKVLSLNILILMSFAIPEDDLILKTISLFIANAVLFFSTRSKIDIGAFISISGWRFYKIESISTIVSLIELPLIAYAVIADEVIIYLLLSRILYMPVLFYGQVSRFLWSDGIKHLLGKSYTINPKLANAIYGGLAIVGLIILSLGFDVIVRFVDESIKVPSKILIATFSLWTLVQIANRFFKNHYLGNAVFEYQYKGFMNIGIVYLVTLFILAITVNEIIFFVLAKAVYSLLIFFYNLSFTGRNREMFSDSQHPSTSSSGTKAT